MGGGNSPHFFRLDFFGTKYKSHEKRIVGWQKTVVDIGVQVGHMNLN